MSDLLPEGFYTAIVKKCHKDTMSDGSEVLFVEAQARGPDNQPHTFHDVITTQARLDQFLLSLGYQPGAMKLKSPHSS